MFFSDIDKYKNRRMETGEVGPETPLGVLAASGDQFNSYELIGQGWLPNRFLLFGRSGPSRSPCSQACIGEGKHHIPPRGIRVADDLARDPEERAEYGE
jgi:hypothetical protein